MIDPKVSAGSLPGGVRHGRNQALDGLRGVAALIVALSHFMLAFQPGFLSGNPATGAWLAASLARTPAIIFWNPEFGVAVFFVLSGLVLSASAETTRLSFPALLLRRWIRLALPILGSSLLTWFAIEAGALHNASAAAANGSHWLASQFAWTQQKSNDLTQVTRQSLFDIFTSHRNRWNQALWTMQIEFVGSIGMYSCMLLLRCFGAGKRSLLAAALAVGAVVPTLPYVEFAAGVALFAATKLLAGKTGPGLAGSGGLLLAVAAVLAGGMPWAVVGGPYWRVFIWLANFTTEPIAIVHALAAVLAVACVLVWRPARQLFSHPIATALGRISFMIYLCQIFVLVTVTSWVIPAASSLLGYDGASVVGLACFLAVLILLADVMTRICDRPAIGLSHFVSAAADRWAGTLARSIAR